MALVVSGDRDLYFCYIDEAGCTGNLSSHHTDIQPVFVLCGLIVPEQSIAALTHDFLALKRQFNPALTRTLEHDLDIIKYEIKGAEDLRKPIRKRNRNSKRRAIGFLDKVLELLDRHNCRIVPRIYIKSPKKTFDGIALYSHSVQYIIQLFQSFLVKKRGSHGIVIADSRNYDLNIRVSHSIFTQKFKTSGDAYPNVMEMPVYGHSDNHVAIQITDIVCSALLFPIATYAYCTGYITSVHVNDCYKVLQTRYANQLKTLSFRYHDGTRHRGGITVFDALAQRNANHFLILHDHSGEGPIE